MNSLSTEDTLAAIIDSSEEEMDDSNYENDDDFESERSQMTTKMTKSLTKMEEVRLNIIQICKMGL